MKLKIFIIIFIAFISTCIISYAHPGRLDSNGGHYNRATGEYHYHNGSHSSGSSSSVEELNISNDTSEEKSSWERYKEKVQSKKENPETKSQNITTSNDDENKNYTWKDWIGILIVFIFPAYAVIYTVVGLIIDKIKGKRNP